MDSGKTAETDETPLSGQQSSSILAAVGTTIATPPLVLPPSSSEETAETDETSLGGQQLSSIPAAVDATIATAPLVPPPSSSLLEETIDLVVAPESSITQLAIETIAAEQDDLDPPSPSTVSSPTIITAPPSYNLNPAIFPEPLPADARPLNPDGSTPWSVYTIAGVANVVAEGIPMLVNFGLVLPTTLNFLARHNVGARFNFGGFWGDLAQSSSQMVPAAAVLAVSSYLFFTYGTPLTAAGIGGQIKQRDPYDVYPSFKISPHPGSQPAGELSAEWRTAHQAHNAGIRYAQLYASRNPADEQHGDGIRYAQKHHFERLVTRPDPGTPGYTAVLQTYLLPTQTKLRETAYELLKSKPFILTDHPGQPIVEGALNTETGANYTEEEQEIYQTRLATHNAEVDYLNKCLLNNPYLLPTAGSGLIPPHPGFEDDIAALAYNAQITALNAPRGGFLSILENARTQLREGRFRLQQESVESGNIASDQTLTQCFSALSAVFQLAGFIANPKAQPDIGVFPLLGAGIPGVGYGFLTALLRLGRRHNAPAAFLTQTEAHNNALARQASPAGLPAGTAPIPATAPTPLSVPTHYVRNKQGFQATREARQDVVDEANAPLHTDVEYKPIISGLETAHNQLKLLGASGLGDLSGLLASTVVESIFNQQFGTNLSPGQVFLKEYLSNYAYMMGGNLSVEEQQFLENLHLPWDTPVFHATTEQIKRVGRNLAWTEVEFPHLTDLLWGDDATHAGAKVTRVFDHLHTTWRNTVQIPQQTAVDSPHAIYRGGETVVKGIAKGVSYTRRNLASIRRQQYGQINDALPGTMADADFGRAIENARHKAKQAYISALFGPDKSPSKEDVAKKQEEIAQSATACRNGLFMQFRKRAEKILTATTEPDEVTLQEFRKEEHHIKNAFQKKLAESLEEKVFLQEIMTRIVEGLTNNTMSSKDAGALVKSLLEHKDIGIDHQQFQQILKGTIDKIAEGKSTATQTQLADHQTMLTAQATEAINHRTATNTLRSITKMLMDENTNIDITRVTALVTPQLTALSENDMPQEQFMEMTKAAFLAAAKNQTPHTQEKLQHAEKAITKMADELWTPPFVDAVDEQEDLDVMLRHEIRKNLDMGITAADIVNELKKVLADPNLRGKPEEQGQLLQTQMHITNLIFEVSQQRQNGQKTPDLPQSVEVKRQKAKKAVNTRLKNLIANGHSLDVCQQVIEQLISQQPSGTTRDTIQAHLIKAIERAHNVHSLVDEILNTLIRNGKPLDKCKEAIQKKMHKTEHGPTKDIMRAYLPHAMKLAEYAEAQGFTHGYQHVDLPLNKRVKGEGLSVTQIAVVDGAGQNHARIYTLKPGEKIGGLIPEPNKRIEGKLTGPTRNNQSETQNATVDKKPMLEREKKKRQTKH
ncbi:MAG: hypothetical protein V4568_18315 [Pseudomonadota bacterium]